jgi:hypothetical protein
MIRFYYDTILGLQYFTIDPMKEKVNHKPIPNYSVTNKTNI